MKILLFSDSHGYTHNMIRAINQNNDVDMVMHLGDFVKDAVKISAMYSSTPFEYVYGNNDWTRECTAEKILEVCGKRIFITHGHIYGVKYGLEKLVNKGKAVNADAVFFGHTHITEEMYLDGMLLLNPGSISIPVQSKNPTYCTVEIKDGKFKVRFGALT